MQLFGSMPAHKYQRISLVGLLLFIITISF